MTIVFITLQLQFLFVLQNKIIKWSSLKKKIKKKRQKETLYLKMAVIDWWETQVVKDSG